MATSGPKERGPYAYENWLAFLAGGPFEGGFEFPLYSDAEFQPQANRFWGPYTLFNTLSGPSPYSTVRPLLCPADQSPPNAIKLGKPG